MSRIKAVPSACTVTPILVPSQKGNGPEFYFTRDIVSMMTTGRFHADLKISMLLIVLTLLVFARAGGMEFLSYDDNLYVTDNQTVQGGLSWSNAAWAFTTMNAANWHPLTWLSLMLDIQLFGPRPGALHLVNVLFHAVNAVLLFLILARMTGAKWRSAFVAALFAIHPLHVESVAWVAERKDVLSVLFGLLTIWAYVRYTTRTALSYYAWVVLFFVFSLMSKPMLVTMPFLLLLLDYWPLGRMGGSLQPVPGTVPVPQQVPQQASLTRLIAEKIPLIVLCAASSVVTVVAQKRSEAIGDVALSSLGLRLADAAVGYVRYLGKTFWPGSLSVFYPHPETALPMWQSGGAVLLLLLITALVLLRLRQSPWLAVGWFWFIGTLVPVIGLVQVGAQSIADRYTYFPLIGVFIMIAWRVPELLKGLRVTPRMLGAASMLVIVVLAGITWRQLGFWKTHETLFRHALSVTTNNCVAHANLAEALLLKGELEEASVHLEETLRLCPNDQQSWYNLGLLQKNRGELPEAEYALREAARLGPDHAASWHQLGLAYVSLGRRQEALEVVQTLRSLDAGMAEDLRRRIGPGQ